MPSEWKVSKTYAGGVVFYQVYRILNTDQIDHSGNREIVGTFNEEQDAVNYCKEMNGWDE